MVEHIINARTSDTARISAVRPDEAFVGVFQPGGRSSAVSLVDAVVSVGVSGPLIWSSTDDGTPVGFVHDFSRLHEPNSKGKKTKVAHP